MKILFVFTDVIGFRKVERLNLGRKMINNLPQSSSYESAMEALSSLITQKRRGEMVPVIRNEEKLKRMRKYIEVTLLQSVPNEEIMKENVSTLLI